MSFTSSELVADFRLATALSIAVFSAAATLSPSSLIDFSVEWIRASAWFLASTSSRLR
jgi:hypothetical protein